ncbi:MAG: DNA internalization-related competence protein ComEC/Rec2 [Lachnospiraceae bacterium]|nr:DNA internalization-related competence protein ComEC/Rec2 [Lachnospiraceae bacterium]
MARRPLCMVCLAVILFIFMGTKLAGISPPDYSKWEGRAVTVTGRVYKKECAASAGREILYLRLIESEDNLHQADTERKAEKQNIICYLKANQILPEMGSIVRVKGKLQCFEKPSNPGQFDAESYYHTLKISFQLNQTEIQGKSQNYNYISEKLYQIRVYFSDILDSLLSGQDASVMKMMLLGEKKAADKEIKELYQRNGMAHVLAISGLHISLLGMSLFRILRKTGLPIWIAAGLPAFLMVMYGIMTGFSVSALRAVCMFMIHMTAKLFGRTYDLITAAFLAAVLIVINQPLYLWDSSFLFSFGCIFAIGFLVPALTREKKTQENVQMRQAEKQEKKQKPVKQPGKVLTAFLSGGAITMAGLPLQLHFFYQTPLYATFLNLLVIPLMSLLLPVGILLCVFGRWKSIGSLLAIPIAGCLSVYEKLCLIFEKLPFHTVMPGRPAGFKIFIYISVLLAVVIFQKKLSLKKKWAMVILGAVLLFLPGTGETAVTFLDVGQGDCIHIKSEAGNHYLIDGGSTTVSNVGTYRIIPFLKEQGADKIEAVFVTHPDADHCNGIKELLEEGKEQGIQVKRLYLPDIDESVRDESYNELIESAEENGVPCDFISKGYEFREEDFQLLCLHPEKGYANSEANQYSTVLLFQTGFFKALLTGDVEGNGERELQKVLEEMNLSNITVLKAAHHGSEGSTPEEMLAVLSPAYTVISCGENNSYGHPHAKLLERLDNQKTEILITYESGAITFRTDGRKLKLEEFLKID